MNAVLDGRTVDIDINKGRITDIRPAAEAAPRTIGSGTTGAGTVGATDEVRADGAGPHGKGRRIDAGGRYAVPSLKNGHTHAAMTLLRGFADDMKLGPWLEKVIWPAEAQLEPEDVYWGNRLAALEMIRSGTTFCADMYFHFEAGRRAFLDAGIKAAVGPAIFDFGDAQAAARVQSENEELYRRFGRDQDGSEQVVSKQDGRDQDGRDHSEQEKASFLLSPHSIYTVSEETLRWVAGFSAEHDLPVHIHLAETREEVDNCMAACDGLRPAEYLDRLGLLSPRLLAAHAIWLSDREIELLADRGVTVVHNPVSNMKLASGSCFPFRRLADAGVAMLLGTDGCSSNNNLDMFEEMKIAALLQKHHHGDTELMSAAEILRIASGGSASLFPGIAGTLEEGDPADLLLIDPERPEMTPAYNLASNLVYSAGGAAVYTVVCAGEIVMEGGKVPGEEEVLAEARERARLLEEKTGRR